MKLFKKCFFILVTLSLFFVSTVKASAPIEIKPTTPAGLLAFYGIKQGLEHEQIVSMIDTAKCESGLRPGAINHTKREYSVGIAQINLNAHKDVTLEQAKDPDFSALWMSQKFADGKQNMWTCWHKL